MHHHIVDRVELPAVERAHQHPRLIRWLRLHEDDPARRVQRPLRAEDDAVEVVHAAVGHVHALRRNLLALDFGGREVRGQRDATYLDLLAALVVGELVARDEERVVALDEDARLVREGVVLVLVQELQRRVRAEQPLHGVVVDGKSGCVRHGSR